MSFAWLTDLAGGFWNRLAREAITTIVMVVLIGYCIWKIEDLDDKVDECYGNQIELLTETLKETNETNKKTNEISEEILKRLQK